MKEEADYLHDISQIRGIMERSTRFLSLSGGTGIFIGIYCLAGAWLAWKILGYKSTVIMDSTLAAGHISPVQTRVLLIALGLIILTISTTLAFSIRRATVMSEKLWSPASRRLLFHLSLPLISSGILLLILLFQGVTGLLAPLSLLFYGLALINAAKFSYDELRVLGIVQIILGLTATAILEYSLLLWAVGFGFVHIAYGIYMYLKYER